MQGSITVHTHKSTATGSNIWSSIFPQDTWTTGLRDQTTDFQINGRLLYQLSCSPPRVTEEFNFWVQHGKMTCALNTSINAEWSDFDACLGIKRSTATTIHKIFFASNASFVCATFPGFSSPRFQYHFLSPISKAFAVKSNLQPHVFSKCSLFGITACESKLV